MAVLRPATWANKKEPRPPPARELSLATFFTSSTSNIFPAQWRTTAAFRIQSAAFLHGRGSTNFRFTFWKSDLIESRGGWAGMSNFRLRRTHAKGFDPNTLKLGDLVQLFWVATLSGLNVRSFGSAFRSMFSESVRPSARNLNLMLTLLSVM